MSGIYIVEAKKEEKPTFEGMPPRWFYNGVRGAMLLMWVALVLFLALFCVCLFAGYGIVFAEHLGAAVPEDPSVLFDSAAFRELLGPPLLTGFMLGLVFATHLMNGLAGGLTGDDKFWKFVITSYDRAMEEAIKSFERWNKIMTPPSDPAEVAS